MSWLHRLLHRDQMESQLSSELAYHLEQHTADLIGRGHSAEEARRLARLEIGGPEQVKEGCRDARGTRWLEDFVQDFRYALRTLGQNRAFAAVTLCTLSLGIGATTVMFSVVSGVLLKPLPYPDAGRLAGVHAQDAKWNVSLYGPERLSRPDFLDLQRGSRAMDIGGFLYDTGTVSEPGDAAYVEHREISANLFSVLKVPLFLGRSFLAEEDRAGAPRVAIIGYTFWQQRFAGALDAIGRTLVLDRVRYTVVGITRPDFRLDDQQPDVYTPLNQDTARYLQGRRAHPVETIGRLRSGATLAQAQSEVAGIARALERQYSDTNSGRGFEARALRPEVGTVRSTLWLLLGAVGLVLLIACVNVASLLLARAVSRERELAMRVALGAGRGRLIRQCLTESAVLGLCGGALGILLARAGLRPFVTLWPGTLPRADEVQLDWRVLLFTFALSLAASLLFGMAPALRLPVRSLDQALRTAARSLAGGSRRLHGAFVVSEIALALVLLVSAGMLGRTMIHLASLDPGVNVENVLAARVSLSTVTLANTTPTRAAWQDLLEHVRRIPGVQAVAMVDTVPMRSGNNPLAYWPSADLPPEDKRPLALASSVSNDYLRVMGIPLREGRFFDDHDRIEGERVIVIDEVMARNAFPGRSAVGQRIWSPDMGEGPLKVVGVVGHVRYWGLAGDDQAQIRAQFYYPWSQVPDRWVRRWSELMSIAVRTSVPPLSILPSLRREVRGATGDQVLYQVRTMDQLAASSVARQRWLMLLFGIFAALALVLACVGIYGVLAYLTGRRVAEIGIRMALGAAGRDCIWLVLRQSLAMILSGVVIGLAGALGAAQLLLNLVEGMTPGSAATFAMTVAVLVLAASIASFLPARRAARIDPMAALRL